MNQYSRLCQNALSCPFGPDEASFTYTFNVSDAYQGVPFNSRFVIINSVDEANIVGCVEVQVTHIIASYAWYVVAFCIIGIAVLIAISFVITAYLNPWTGTTNIYSWSSTLYREVNVVRLLTPGLFDFLHYFQFAFFITSLSLEYPSFLQPVISTFSWVVLMFNQSFVSHNGSGKFADGVYATNGTFGLDRMSQVAQLAHAKDVWASFMVWLLVVTGAILVIGQLAVLGTWAWRKYRSDTYDLRSRAVSFAFGLVLRIFFRVFHLPLLVFCFFQCVITHMNDQDGTTNPAYLTVLAVLVLVSWVSLAVFISYHLWKRAQRPTIFDNLSTLLKFGTLYNTYTEESAMFFVIEFATSFLRALTIGGIQGSGLAQITLLAVIELAYFFAVVIIRPFDHKTSMNLISCIITGVRFTLIMLSLPFISSTGVSAYVRQWLGYVILLFHALALLLFLMRAIQVIIEVISRYTGAGAESKRAGAIYNLKQLSRRRRRPHVDMTELATTTSSENNKPETPPHSDGTEMENVDQEEDEYSSRRQRYQRSQQDDDLHRTPSSMNMPVSASNSSAVTRGGYTAVYPSANNREGLFEDVFLSSPTSDISSTGGSAPVPGPPSTSNPANSPVGFTRTPSLGTSSNPAQAKYSSNDTVYYRKPRRRESSHDWPSSPYLRTNIGEESVNDNSDNNEDDYEEYDEDSGRDKKNGNLDEIRMGVVSPPPPGVDYAVREADIYYRQRREYNKKRRRHKKQTDKNRNSVKNINGNDSSNNDNLHDKSINNNTSGSNNTKVNDDESSSGRPEEELLHDYEPYGGAASELLGDISGSRQPRHSQRGGSGEFDYSQSSTPGRLSLVQSNESSHGDGLVSGAAKHERMEGGILQQHGPRRNRNLNSLVGLLETDEMYEWPGSANPELDSSNSGVDDSKSAKGLAAATAATTSAVTGWFSRVKTIGGKIRGGILKDSKPAEEDDLLKPRGFEVLRRGPIRSYRSSSSSSLSSTTSSSSSVSLSSNEDGSKLYKRSTDSQGGSKAKSKGKAKSMKNKAGESGTASAEQSADITTASNEEHSPFGDSQESLDDMIPKAVPVPISLPVPSHDTHSLQKKASGLIFPESTPSRVQEYDNQAPLVDVSTSTLAPVEGPHIPRRQPPPLQRNNSSVPTLRILTSQEALQLPAQQPIDEPSTAEGGAPSGRPRQQPMVVANKKSKESFNFF